MKQAAFAYSVQGASHKKRENNPENIGKTFPCQDRAFFGDFPPSSMVEKKEVHLSVKNTGRFFFDTLLPVKLCPHTAGFSLLCVADGHGGAPYFRSEKGAEFAIQTAIELLSESIDKIDAALQEKNYSKANKSLSKSFLRRWIRKIIEDIGSTKPEELTAQIDTLKKTDLASAEVYEKDLETAKILADRYSGLCENTSLESEENTEINTIINDFYALSIKSMYGCTAVVYFHLKDSPRWYAFKIGDSDFFASFDGVFVKPIKDDTRCFLNETTSLCDDNALQEFCFPEPEYLEKSPASVFCSTDGVANSFQDESFLIKFYDKVQFMFDEDGNYKAEKEIKEYLPKLSEQGSGDDMSLAGIIFYDDSIEAKKLRRKSAQDLADKYWHAGNYPAIEPLLKPYIDRGESQFKYFNAIYDFGETRRLEKLHIPQNFMKQWDKTYRNLNDIKTDIALINEVDKLNRLICQLDESMQTVIEKDINASINVISPKYIDDLFSPFITSELNRYTYYKAFYAYTWLKKCFDMGLMTTFFDSFNQVEANLTLIATSNNFKDIEHASALTRTYLSELSKMKSKYWDSQNNSDKK